MERIFLLLGFRISDDLLIVMIECPLTWLNEDFEDKQIAKSKEHPESPDVKENTKKEIAATKACRDSLAKYSVLEYYTVVYTEGMDDEDLYHNSGETSRLCIRVGPEE